ncbi:hypothetical protein RND71_023041 [Anisodus tanguticus]|uniref:Putative plant transposon protein domain-containing protein n=1 Tax=Anisodus tanguticus TaxID=243964 RepID=A0AAE1VB88_9SOLA|nr:hypothetical protein RND71_023041 [Anisodus tanguticus]
MRNIVEFQNWTHIFVPPAPSVYEAEVAEVYANLCHIDDYTMFLSMNGIKFMLNELVLGEILEVQIHGMKIVSREDSTAFKNVIAKREESTTKARLIKNELKPEYQLMFAFVNKVLLPMTEGHYIASVADLVLIETLSAFQPVSLPAIMIEHMIKVVNTSEGRHGLTYGFLLTKVLAYFKVRTGKATLGTKKHMFIMATLEEYECVPRKAGVSNTSTISTPIEDQEAAMAEIQRLKAENALLRVQLAKKTQESSSHHDLETENEKLRVEKGKLRVKVDELQDQMLHD